MIDADPYAPRRMTVKVRRGPFWAVKPESELIDGKTFVFTFCGVAENDSIYEGEKMYMPKFGLKQDYPDDAPIWIADGDLEETK